MYNFNDPMSQMQYPQQFPQAGQPIGGQNDYNYQGVNPALRQALPDSFQKTENSSETGTNIAVGTGLAAAFAAIAALAMRKPSSAVETIKITEKTVKGNGGFFKSIGNFFGKIGNSIKKGFNKITHIKLKRKKTAPANQETIKKDGFFKRMFKVFKRDKKTPVEAPENTTKKDGFWTRLKKSFKRTPNALTEAQKETIKLCKEDIKLANSLDDIEAIRNYYPDSVLEKFENKIYKKADKIRKEIAKQADKASKAKAKAQKEAEKLAQKQQKAADKAKQPKTKGFIQKVNEKLDKIDDKLNKKLDIWQERKFYKNKIKDAKTLEDLRDFWDDCPQGLYSKLKAKAAKIRKQLEKEALKKAQEGVKKESFLDKAKAKLKAWQREMNEAIFQDDI